MKAFARWLYMATHGAELVEMARRARAPMPASLKDASFTQVYEAGKEMGYKEASLDALATLGLIR